MATEKVKKPSGLETIVGKEAYEKMGNYKEATGGGTPIPKGEKLADHPEAKRVKQPRDDDGRFTYNAVNFKELKTKESRGKTVPPFLRGVKINFAKKGEKNYMWFNDKRYEVDLENMDKDEFAKMFRKYKGELEDGTLVFGENDKEYKLSPEKKAKAGAYSKSEKATKELGDATHTLYDINSEDFSQDFGYYIDSELAKAEAKGPKPKFKPETEGAETTPQPKPEQPEAPAPAPTPEAKPEKKGVESLLGLDDDNIDIDESNIKDIFQQFSNK